MGRNQLETNGAEKGFFKIKKVIDKKDQKDKKSLVALKIFLKTSDFRY